MDLSGIIFVVLALAWAVYLIPKALKHHDEVARTRSIDRFSTAMRVLARREPVNRRDTRLVVTPARSSSRVLVPSPASSRAAAVEVTAASADVTDSADDRPARAPQERQALQARRAAARAAARRRRHILIFLLLLDAAVVTVAAFALVPWWSVAVPVALTLCYLVLCRRQVRRENESSWTARPAAVDERVAPRRAIRIDAPYGMPVSGRNDQGFEEVSPDEETVEISSTAISAALVAASVDQADAAAVRAVELETVAVAVPTVDGGSLWDPLPMTLPTYVSKPRAARTVRTIDLSEPGTWSSGRSVADTKLVEQAGAATDRTTGAPSDGETGTGEQQAVNS